MANRFELWFSYSQIGNHVFLKGTLSGKSSANNSTIATLGSTLAPSKNKYFTMLLRAGTGSTAAYVWAKVKLTTTGALILTNSVSINGSGGSTTPSALYGSFDIEYWR